MKIRVEVVIEGEENMSNEGLRENRSVCIVEDSEVDWRKGVLEK